MEETILGNGYSEYIGLHPALIRYLKYNPASCNFNLQPIDLNESNPELHWSSYLLVHVDAHWFMLMLTLLEYRIVGNFRGAYISRIDIKFIFVVTNFADGNY